nr:DUF1007 family protein [Propylenella binzhouense]
MRSLLAAMLSGVLLGSAQAHPHVWVDAASEIVFDKAGAIVAVRHHWRFDEAFSSFAVQGLDTDGDGKLTKEELQPLAQVNVESLAEYDFFTWLGIGDKASDFAAPTDYWLDDDRGRLILHYTLPLKKPLKPSGTVEIEIGDPEYFVAFSLPSKQAVRLVDAPAGCALVVTPAKVLSPQAQAALAAVGADQRELPPELQDLTEGTDNSAAVACK